MSKSNKTHPGIGFAWPHMENAISQEGKIEHKHTQVKANLGKTPLPKRAFTDSAPEIHSGMKTQTSAGQAALGGDHRSAVDSLTGNVVVPGRVTATPGFGNGGVQSGHPLAKAPGSKNLKPVPPSFGMKDDGTMHALGDAMLSEAFANSAGDDRMAHGRDKSGRK